MTPAQNEAVKSYRNRQKEKGMVRVEVAVPDTDRKLIRQTASNLRAGGEIAERTRAAMRSVINPYAGMNFKQLLEAAPIEGLDLERSKETARDIDL
jgi:hypothetical protein